MNSSLRLVFSAVCASEGEKGGEMAMCRPGPDRLQHALNMLLHQRGGGPPQSHHVLHLRSRRLRVLPGTTDHIEAFHGEVNRGRIGPRVMPVANDHVLWNQSHRRVSVNAARRPFSQTRKFA